MTRPRASRIARLIIVALVPAIVLGVFVAAFAAADTGTATVPAAIVNNDKFVQTKGTDGKTSVVAAGRLLVSGLTKPSTAKSGATIDWQLSNTAQAASLLKSGQVYAIVTIPKGFSKAISSLSSKDPMRADINIRTDDAHGYIVSQLGSIVGGTLTSTLGSTITTSVVKGLYGGYGTLKTSLAKAGSGATKLGTGTKTLSTGLGKLATGTDGIAAGTSAIGSGTGPLADGADALASGLHTAASGARSATSGAKKLSQGVTAYTGGVDALSSGLNKLSRGSASLQQLPAGVKSYTAGVSSASSGLAAIIAADPTISPRTRAALQQVQQGLSTLSSSGPALVTGAEGAATVQSAVAASAAGAKKLAAGSPALRSGTSSLASGLSAFAPGLDKSAAGATALGAGARKLGSGADTLAAGAAKIAGGLRQSQAGADKIAAGNTTLGSGLTSGASKVPAVSTGNLSKVAGVVADPVGASATQAHKVQSPGLAIASLILPIGLWIGASAVVLLFGAVRRRLLATGVGTARLVGSAFVRGALLGVAQAVLLIVVLQATFALRWSAVPLALLVAAVAGVAFFAVHQALGAILGRAGTVVSILLLALQLFTVGGLYPIELVWAPFQVLSPYLPLTPAVTAMQAIIAGADGGAVAGGIAVLVLYAVVAFVVTSVVTARRRASVALFAAPGLPAIG